MIKTNFLDFVIKFLGSSTKLEQREDMKYI